MLGTVTVSVLRSDTIKGRDGKKGKRCVHMVTIQTSDHWHILSKTYFKIV